MRVASVRCPARWRWRANSPVRSGCAVADGDASPAAGVRARTPLARDDFRFRGETCVCPRAGVNVSAPGHASGNGVIRMRVTRFRRVNLRFRRGFLLCICSALFWTREGDLRAAVRANTKCVLGLGTHVSLSTALLKSSPRVCCTNHLSCNIRD
jgi:hypothetical protein